MVRSEALSRSHHVQHVSADIASGGGRGCVLAVTTASINDASSAVSRDANVVPASFCRLGVKHPTDEMIPSA